MNNPLRWRQRFENFEKAFVKLEMVVGRADLKTDEVCKMALVQAFEFTFEIAWKTMKDYLEEEGFELNSPKETLRQAFQSRLITDGEVWLEALKRRNNTVHNYDSVMLEETVTFIVASFVPQAREWRHSFASKSTV